MFYTGMKFVFSLMLLFFSFNFEVEAQNSDSLSCEQIFVMVDEMPLFKGGEREMFQYISENVVYPAYEKKHKIQGTVYVYFVIDKIGSVRDVKIARGAKDAPGLDGEALRVISSMPKWINGMHNGKPICVQYTLPLKFIL